MALLLGRIVDSSVEGEVGDRGSEEMAEKSMVLVFGVSPHKPGPL